MNKIPLKRNWLIIYFSFSFFKTALLTIRPSKFNTTLILKPGLTDQHCQRLEYVGKSTCGNDSTNVFEGKYAGKLTALSDEPSFGGIVYKIPIKGLVGDSVSLEAKIRYKNIAEGFVGLILRVERDGNTLEFDNLQRLNLHGSKDWEDYKTTLPLGKGMDQVTVAGIIQGKGTAWFDNFVVKIDGIDIQSIEKPQEKQNVINEDEFDKAQNINFRCHSK